jgi:predicted  nucleic acid-binding Zn ribbon protein
MATDPEIVNGLNDYLRANGFICGRKFASINGVANAIAGRLPNETPQSLEPKIRRVVSDPAYRFKSTGQNDVSASEPACGN